MGHGECRAPDHDGAHNHFNAERAGNIAQVISVGNQTINLGNRPEWIQSLTLEDLKTAERRLYRASVRHEARSVLPLVLPIVVFLLVGWGLNTWASAQAQAPTETQRVLLSLLGLIFAVPLWLNMYDVRRRNLEVVRAAERRWAEVTVEIALRTDFVPAPPATRLVNWMKTRANRVKLKEE